MPVRIRLQRRGARHKAFYRLVAADGRSPRDGRFLEILGTYNPQSKVVSREVEFRLERVDYWLGVGAQPSHTARSLILRARRDAARAPEPEAVAAEEAAVSPGTESSAPAKAVEVEKVAEAAQPAALVEEAKSTEAADETEKAAAAKPEAEEPAVAEPETEADEQAAASVDKEPDELGARGESSDSESTAKASDSKPEDKGKGKSSAG